MNGIYKITIECMDEKREAVMQVIKALQNMQDVTVHVNGSDSLYFFGIEIHPKERQVQVAGQPVFLTAREFDLLYYLASSAGQVFTKEQIYEAVWKETPVSIDNTVMCLLSELRRKLTLYSKKEYIHTVRGVGYKFQSLSGE